MASCFRNARVTLLVVVFAILPLPATAQSSLAAQLPGWWISIDEVGHKPLWDRGVIVPMEELLIIDERLNFENRMMGFFRGDPESCSMGGPCSDAPLIATGRLALAVASPGMLSIEDHRATTATLDHKDVDRFIRERAVSTTRSWRFSLTSDGADLLLFLRRQPDDEPRAFVKVEPDRLRRLRAGFRMTELSAFKHWRCWITGATEANSKTPPFRPAAQLSRLIADYIRIASYQQTAEAQSLRPMPDHPDPARRKQVDVKVEELMSERFDALPQPATWEATRRPGFIATYIGLASRGQTAAAAKATLQAYDPQFNPPDDISPGEIAAATLANSDTPESKKLFCNP